MRKYRNSDMQDPERIPAPVHAASSLELPPGLLSGIPQIELSGNHEAVVDGCRGVLEYDEHRILLDLGKLKLLFVGHSLQIRRLTADGALVEGYIRSMEFCE